MKFLALFVLLAVFACSGELNKRNLNFGFNSYTILSESHKWKCTEETTTAVPEDDWYPDPDDDTDMDGDADQDDGNGDGGEDNGEDGAGDDDEEDEDAGLYPTTKNPRATTSNPKYGKVCSWNSKRKLFVGRVNRKRCNNKNRTVKGKKCAPGFTYNFNGKKRGPKGCCCVRRK
jgi:hypothetical protein